MLKYLQWLAVAGVWLPLLAVAAWFGFAWVASQVGPGLSNGWGMAIIGVFLLVAGAHAMAISSVVGVVLLVSQKAQRVVATAVSALLGGSVGALVLGNIYLGWRVA